MSFLLLFIGVFSFLSAMAWFDPAGHQVFTVPAPRGARSARAAPATVAGSARFLFGERKDEHPCLTPVDCVQSGRCAGHCGWR